MANRGVLDELDEHVRNRLLTAAGQVSRPAREQQRVLARQRRRNKKAARRQHDEDVRALAAIRQTRQQPRYPTPPAIGVEEPLKQEDRPRLKKTRGCYVCKQDYSELHFFYDQMCRPCGDFNFAKRSPSADLRGRVAYVSGARVKIGYQCAILLLRAGAHVIVSTRFPTDAAKRYAAEADFSQWGHRLQIHGLDLRHTPSVEAFAAHLRAHQPRLDFVIHNACQTVRRPPGFYAHLLADEYAALDGPASALLQAHRDLTGAQPGLKHPHQHQTIGLHDAPALSQRMLTREDQEGGLSLFPNGMLDADAQQVDLRQINSWRLGLADVSSVELLEVQLVNAIAPYVLNAKLKPLMLRTDNRDKHIVNVSAMEGQFYRRFKTTKHPHTNMAKAALNMMTRTSAPEFVQDGIHMNSVDTGWVTDEDPVHIARRKAEEQAFSPPLDIVDGAARVVDPIFTGITTGEHVWGQFLKDYRPTAW